MKNHREQEIRYLKIGGKVHSEWQSGLAEPARNERLILRLFLSRMPFFSLSRVIPPHAIINDFLAEGFTAEGMRGTCRWQPFQLSAETFVKLLKADGTGAAFSSPEPAEWVKSFCDWYIWLMEVRHGIPAQEHKRLKDHLIVLEKVMGQPGEKVDQKQVVDFQIRVIEARISLHEFLGKHIEKIGQQNIVGPVGARNHPP